MRPVALAVALGTAMSMSCSPFGGAAFNCTDRAQCGPGGTCQPNGFCSVADPICMSGQHYENAGSLSGDCVPDGTGGDEVPPPPNEPAPTADAPCMIHGVDTCSLTDPIDLNITANDTINTDNGGAADPRCRNFPQAGGPDACLVFASNVRIAAGVTLRGTGSRPLIIVSQTGMTIDGTIDVGSYRSPSSRGSGRDFACTANRDPSDDSGGAGGGAGGSFKGKGGDGGTGDTDNSQDPDGTALGGQAPDLVAVPPPFARGGCKGFDGGDEGNGGGSGKGGKGGTSGGAVWLLANGAVTIGTTGGVRATGAGGSGGQVQAGGGGGGSGGYIKIAAGSVTNAGILSANGGGGGEGGCRCNNIPITGNFGDDGSLSGTAVNGGSTIGMPGGDGGKASDANPDGVKGGDSNVGGGGGGGAAGFIVLSPAPNNTGTISPAFQSP
jgi:hypothetical protein